MRKTFHLIWQMVKVFILFTGCTLFFYYALLWVSEEYRNYDRYDEPEGNAVKVMSDYGDESFYWYQRLLLFYLNGE